MFSVSGSKRMPDITSAPSYFKLLLHPNLTYKLSTSTSSPNFHESIKEQYRFF